MNKPSRPAGKPPGEESARGRVMFSLLHAAHAVEARMEESLGTVGLSPAKFAALTHLVNAEEPMSLTELAARSTCVRSNITQLVDRLEADGLVRRVEDPRDRRSVRAALTPLGRERQAAGVKKMAALLDQVCAVLGGIDCGVLDQVAARLR